MDANQFDERLKELAATVGSDQSTELFNASYAVLLREVQETKGPRFDMLIRMRKLLDHQAQYLMNGWLHYQKAATPPGMIRMQ
jgi:hypothetical protein